MDITYLLLLQNIREALGGVFDSAFLWVTSLGESAVTFALMAGVYWCIDKQIGQYMGMNVALACTANQFLKPLFRIERPWVRDERIRPVEAALPGAGGYSFPSGHTARAVAVWGAAGSAAWKKAGWRGIGAFCWLITGAILFSRNYLGVHTPQDVLVSLLLGIVILIVTARALRLAQEKPDADIWICGAGCVLCFLPMLRVGCLSNAGAGFGFFLGWLIERRTVRFTTEGTVPVRLLRFGIGASLLIFIIRLGNPVLGLFMESKYAGFFVSFLAVFYMMALYPFLWTMWEKRFAAYVEKGYKTKKYMVVIAGACLVLMIGLLGVILLGRRIQTNRENKETQQAAQAQQEVQLEQAGQVQETAEAEEAQPHIAEEQSNGESENDENTVQIIAHRGYSGVFPENTMAAFAGALDIGADYIELDVQMTKDGQIVVCHDDHLKRVAGVDGLLADYTYEELVQLDVGSWFSPAYAGERMPLLSEVLALLQDSDMKLYLELKDIGEREGFEEAVVDIVRRMNMEERCIFASFRYDYLTHIKDINASLCVLYNTTSGKTTLAQEFPAEYYGLYTESITSDTVKAIHAAGKQAFVWTANTPQQIAAVREMGVDGIVTNYPGLAKVAVRPEYEYLVRNFERSITMPGLYEPGREERLDDYVVQGLTKAGNLLVISAYSYSGGQNSILYVMNADGVLQKVVDLQFQAHTGGIAYDGEHDLLWITGPSGHVYAVSWTAVLNDTYSGEIAVDFDAGLMNHNGSKVASFLNLYGGELFVGSYVNGSEGMLKRYDISDPANVTERSAVVIPERIQGITFKEDIEGARTMLLSQGYQTDDSCLLAFAYTQECEKYDEPVDRFVLPEGVEQIQMTAEGMYLLFESAVRPYRATARIPNDQIYIVRP